MSDQQTIIDAYETSMAVQPPLNAGEVENLSEVLPAGYEKGPIPYIYSATDRLSKAAALARVISILRRHPVRVHDNLWTKLEGSLKHGLSQTTTQPDGVH